MGNAWVAYEMESGFVFLFAGMGAHIEKECIFDWGQQRSTYPYMLEL